MNIKCQHANYDALQNRTGGMFVGKLNPWRFCEPLKRGLSPCKLDEFKENVSYVPKYGFLGMRSDEHSAGQNLRRARLSPLVACPRGRRRQVTTLGWEMRSIARLGANGNTMRAGLNRTWSFASNAIQKCAANLFSLRVYLDQHSDEEDSIDIWHRHPRCSLLSILKMNDQYGERSLCLAFFIGPPQLSTVPILTNFWVFIKRRQTSLSLCWATCLPLCRMV